MAQPKTKAKAAARRNGVFIAALNAGSRTSRVSGIISSVFVFHAQRTDGADLRHILARLRPVEVPRVARQNDNSAGWMGLEFFGLEPIAEADIEDPGHDRINSILRVFMRHELHAGRN